MDTNSLEPQAAKGEDVSWYSGSSATKEYEKASPDMHASQEHLPRVDNSHNKQENLAQRTQHQSLDQEKEQNLSEISAPAPIQRRGNFDQTRTLEQRERPSPKGIEEKEGEELTELAAPPPLDLDPSGNWRRHPDLESSRRQQALQITDHDAPSALATQIYIVSYLIFFSIMGTLSRLGVQWLTFYKGAPVIIDNLWANFGGTLVMGFLSEDIRLFKEEWGHDSYIHAGHKSRFEKFEKAQRRGTRETRAAHLKVKKTIPMFIGLATGYCGSFTSFSTFMRDVFLAISNDLPSPLNHPNELAHDTVTSTVPRNNAYSLAAALAVWILTIACSNGAFMLGAHIAVGVDKFTPTLPFKFVRRIVDPIFVLLAFGCWLGAVFLSIWPPDRHNGPSSQKSGVAERWRGEVLFALVFAPLGCLLRFYLSLKLNGILPWFPLGTFAANMFGVAVQSMAYVLQHVPLSIAPTFVGGGLIGCQVLQGIEDGFCGALTTVSTWIVELDALRRRHAYFYGAASLFGGTALVVIIYGSVRWSVGFSAPACITSNS